MQSGFFKKILMFCIILAGVGCHESTPYKGTDSVDELIGDLMDLEEFEETDTGLEEEGIIQIVEEYDGDIFDDLMEVPSDSWNDGFDYEQDEAGEDISNLPFGAHCTSDFQCASGVCLPDELGGTCSVTCRNERTCTFSHAGTSCTPFGKDTDGDGLTDSVVTACAPRPPDSLPAGRRCADANGCHTRLCLEDGICSNVCSSNSDCVMVSVCQERDFSLEEGSGTYFSCGFDSVSSTVTQYYEMGPLTLITEATGGVLQEIMVPPDAVSLTITTLQNSPSQSVVLGYLEVYDSSNIEIYDMIDYYNGLDPINWHVPWIRMGIFMVPITPRMSFTRGSYRFLPVAARFSESDPAVAVNTEVVFQLKRSPSASVSSGILNVNFFFVGLDSVNATNAQVPGSEFQSVINWFAGIYSTAGISLGSFSYHDVTEPDRSTYRILHVDMNDPQLGELSGLFRLSSGMTGNSVNVFLVHDIDQSGVLGMSPGIPGPQGIHGTGASGVVINYDSMWDSRSAGMVIAHEVGHYLGLFHSTEQRADPYPGDCIPDTVTGDSRNLMHWSWGGTELTPGQSFVMLRAAVVQ